MSHFPYDTEAREDQICQLIDARTKAIRLDLLIGRRSTTDAVLGRLDIRADEIQLRTILWNAVAGGSSAVGADHAEAVSHAIFKEAEALAEADVADMERRRETECDEGRISRAMADREVI